jgi:hypothetical protein
MNNTNNTNYMNNNIHSFIVHIVHIVHIIVHIVTVLLLPDFQMLGLQGQPDGLGAWLGSTPRHSDRRGQHAPG